MKLRFNDYYKKIIQEADEDQENKQEQELNTGLENKENNTSIDDKDSIEQKEKEKTENPEEKEKSKEKENKANLNSDDYKKARDKLIEKFNKENEKQTRVRLEKYNVDEPKSFKIVMEPDIEEIYLDKDKYKKGEIALGLSEIFFNDVNAIGKELGIYDIEWKKSGTLNYGIIRLEKPVEE